MVNLREFRSVTGQVLVAEGRVVPSCFYSFGVLLGCWLALCIRLSPQAFGARLDCRRHLGC